MTLADARRAVAVQCEAALAGFPVIPVTLDPAEVNTPCVVIGPPRQIVTVSMCAYRAQCPVVVCAPPPGGVDAITWLLDVVEVLLGALDATAAEPTRYLAGGQDLPAYEIVVTITN